MNQVRLWKDPAYRRATDVEDVHPSGALQLADKDLDDQTGAGTPATITTSSWICGATVASVLTCPSLKSTCAVGTNGCC